MCDYFASEHGLSPEVTLWQEPMCRLGWMMAGAMRRQGVKGVGRKVDFANVFKLLKQRASE